MPRAQKEKKDKKDKKDENNENEEDPTESKTEKAKWTDYKVRFTLNEFIVEKENGNMNGTTWKPIAFANVTKRYNTAYPEEPMTKRQIKNMYTGRKSTYSKACRLKMNSGIGWVDGECRIDMPKQWWDETGDKDKDASGFRNQTFIFYDQMDKILHMSKPAGALRTGTSSSVRVKAKKGKEEEDESNDDEDKSDEDKSDKDESDKEQKKNKKKADSEPRDAQGLTAAERALDDGSNDGEDSIPELTVDSATRTSKSKKGKEKTIRVELSDSDSEEASTSRKKQPASKSKIKKKTPARQVKPGTLANAIAEASKDSVEKAKDALKRDGLRVTASTDRDRSIEEAARIKAEKFPHQQTAMKLFNLKSAVHFPIFKDCHIAINVLKQEAEAGVFEGLSDQDRWEWLKEEVSEKKKKQANEM
ncbi:uncharacterized protein MELLADRAFT_85516 [Melampsora larici-populina 98AG31]|uniref:Myb/SANT-like domain-containing protein n=1 Tax=Melampsora larici-populina (strain 98AG31 / pathotype 3-4-7) TaxID=747676 RepID=F4RIZ9_MELLP|nr:uncharacterized protein MELLADRAFT_85516 [Melampsora larici-populina 98AG31]EGG07648.1 hypothetical protein MELLADRAFT_85516 [Melampsora larici-populina 98AG31]